MFHESKDSKVSGEVIYIGCGIEPEALVNIATNTISQQNMGHRTQLTSPPSQTQTSVGMNSLEGVYRDIIPNTGVSDSEWLEQVIRQDVKTGEMWRVAINHDEISHTSSDGYVLKPYEVNVDRYRL